MPDGTRLESGERQAQAVLLGAEGDVERWCVQLHCTEVQLQRAIKVVGNSPSRIAEHLQQKYGVGAF